MTPEELSARHPRLFHVTEPGAWPSIRQLGLLSTRRLLDLFEVDGDRSTALARRRRPEAVPLVHPRHGGAVLNDNLPLSEKALAGCLDDGLTPADWLEKLNERVFFWADGDGLDRLLGARMNRGRRREVIVADTLSLARAHADRIELSPINSGSTLRRPARRGLSTFSPLAAHSYGDWRKLRGKRDRIVEVTVRGGVPDIARHVLEIRTTDGDGAAWGR